MYWPGWNKQIPWSSTAAKAKAEKVKLKKSFEDLRTEVRNIERGVKKIKGKLEEHPKYLALENKGFISSSVYPTLFPYYNTQV